MTSSFGVNLFGALTVKGKNVTFDDIDADKDGTITTEEYTKFLNDKKLSEDTVDFSSLDKDGNNEISQGEFTLYEQKLAIQNAVNSLKKTISTDFSGKNAKFIPELNQKLSDLINKFIANYADDVNKMAEAFEVQLPTEYANIKAGLLANSDDSIESRVLETMFKTIKTSYNLSETASAKLQKTLVTEADNFVKNYKGDALETDLTTHLNQYLNTSDKANLKEAVDSWNLKKNSFGDLIDNNELKQLKDYAKTLLTEAVNKGITIKLGGKNVASASAITSALAQYTDGKTLVADLDNAIQTLSDKTKVQQLIEAAAAEDDAAELKKFTDIKGSEYQIDANIIDYTGIDGYFDGSDCTKKAKKTDGTLKNELKEDLQERLETIKPQMKEQIKQMLEAKGVSFDKIETVFENVYNQTFLQTFDMEGMVRTKHKSTFHRGYATTNVKQFVDTFITNFNTNIAAAVDEMNASQTDFDTTDLDFTVAYQDENGNPLTTDNGADLQAAYLKGMSVTGINSKKENYKKYAEQMVDNMKSQMLQKAKAMCQANGVEFDQTNFDTMFNNAKTSAVSNAIHEVSSLVVFSIFNPKTLLETFTTEFKQSYTAWVESEKEPKTT